MINNIPSLKFMVKRISGKKLCIITIACLNSLFFTTGYASNLGKIDDDDNHQLVGMYPSPLDRVEENAQTRLVDGESVFVPWGVWVGTAKGWCSGIAYNQWWVMTADHCGEPRNVYFPKRGSASYDEVPVQHSISSPDDIQLIRLAQPKSILAYPGFDPITPPKLDDVVTMYGYGGSGYLSQLNGKVSYASPRTFTAAIINGKATNGDSGAPMLINGKVVGIHFGGPDNLAGATPLAGVKETLEENGVTGVYDVYLNATKQIEFKISKTLFNSSNKVVVWVDGKYRASMQSGKTKYVDNVVDDGSNMLIKLVGPYTDLNYIQIGVTPGDLDLDSSGTAENSSIIIQKMLNGIDSVTRVPNSRSINVKLSTSLFNSSYATSSIININDKAAGKIHDGHVISADDKFTTVQFTPANPNKVADWVQVVYVKPTLPPLIHSLYEGVIPNLGYSGASHLPGVGEHPTLSH